MRSHNFIGTEHISFLFFKIYVLLVQFELQDEHFMLSRLISDICPPMIVKYFHDETEFTYGAFN